jgi:copper chaperone CopZ
MTTHQYLVENIKCLGCVNSIKEHLLKMKGVLAVEVVIEEQKVCVSGYGLERDLFTQKLKEIGYPEKGKNSWLRKARSLVNC